MTSNCLVQKVPKKKDNCKLLLGKTSHLFYVHSGITEIISVRIAEKLISQMKCKKNDIAFLTGRNHQLSLANKFKSISYYEAGKHAWYGCQPFRGDIYEFFNSYQLAKFLSGLLSSNTFVVYLPHTKLNIARSLIQLNSCKAYYIIEEGSLSHCSLLQFKSRICQLEESLIPSRRKRIKPNIYKFISFIHFAILHPFKHYTFLFCYLFANYTCPAGWFFYLKSKFNGFCALIPNAFIAFNGHKIIYAEASESEIHIINHLRINNPDMWLAPIVLIHNKITSELMIKAINDSLIHANNKHTRVILRPHPDLNDQSITNIIHHDYNVAKLIYPKSEQLRTFPLETMLYAFSSKIYCSSPADASSSVFSYLQLYCSNKKSIDSQTLRLHTDIN
jgi:hypothetical protein